MPVCEKSFTYAKCLIMKKAVFWACMALVLIVYSSCDEKKYDITLPDGSTGVLSYNILYGGPDLQPKMFVSRRDDEEFWRLGELNAKPADVNKMDTVFYNEHFYLVAVGTLVYKPE